VLKEADAAFKQRWTMIRRKATSNNLLSLQLWGSPLIDTLHKAISIGRYENLRSEIGQLDPSNAEDRHKLGTAAKGMRFTNPKGIVEQVWQDGFWVRGNDNEILRKRRSLILRMVKDAPAVAAVLFDKLLVPDNKQLVVRRAVMKNGKAMMTFHSEEFLTEKSMLHAVHADQDDPKAVPVKGYVLALRGILEDEELLQVSGSSAYRIKRFLHDFV
jgi:hypothetical protein